MSSLLSENEKAEDNRGRHVMSSTSHLYTLTHMHTFIHIPTHTCTFINMYTSTHRTHKLKKKKQDYHFRANIFIVLVLLCETDGVLVRTELRLRALSIDLPPFRIQVSI